AHVHVRFLSLEYAFRHGRQPPPKRPLLFDTPNQGPGELFRPAEAFGTTDSGRRNRVGLVPRLGGTHPRLGSIPGAGPGVDSLAAHHSEGAESRRAASRRSGGPGCPGAICPVGLPPRWGDQHFLEEPLVGIEPTTSPLPRVRSTAELQRRLRDRV